MWQNLVGAWPLSRERAHAYVEKAAREAGTSTTWTNPARSSRSSCTRWSTPRTTTRRRTPRSRSSSSRIAPFGWSNSLSQKLLQLTMPGVPDVYQGTELWDFSLVDPDNRRPVDYAAAARSCWPRWTAGGVPPVDETGAAKLLVVSRVLRARRDHPEWFAGYEPVAVDRLGGRPRASPSTAAAWSRWRPGCRRGLAATGWGDTALQLPTGAWRDLLTGDRVVSDAGGAPLTEVLARLPVALLVRD